jgi:hypothetical protein
MPYVGVKMKALTVWYNSQGVFGFSTTRSQEEQLLTRLERMYYMGERNKIVYASLSAPTNFAAHQKYENLKS